MTESQYILVGIAILSIGTYCTRLFGFSAKQFLTLTPNQEQILSDAATTLLFTLAVVGTLFNGLEWAGASRLIGVLFALILIWKKVSLITIVISAAIVTALCRYLGLN